MVGAGGLQRPHHAREAQRVEPLLVEVEVLQAPAHLLGGHHLALAEALLRLAHGLYAQHLDDHAARVQHLAHLVLGTRALALVVDVLHDVLDHLVLRAGAVQRQRVVALGTGAHVAHVRLGTGPPHAVHLVARIAGGLGLLEGGGVHHAPAPKQHVVGTLLAHLQPGGLLLDARRGDRQQRQVKAVHLGALLQQRDRLLAERAVVVDQRDLLALELVQPAQRLGDVLDQDVGAGPVAAHHREVPLEGHAVLRHRQAVAQRHQGDLVGGRLLGQREGDAGGLRVDVGHAGLALQALVALHAAVGGVTGLALLPGQFDAVDAAVARIDHLQVVLLAVGPGRAVGRVGAGAVGQQREELLGLRERAGGDRRSRDHGGGDQGAG